MAIDLGELVVRLRADMKQFTSGLTKAQKKIRTFSAKLQSHMKANAESMKRLGRQLSLRVTLPIIGLAAASIKAGVDIETAFIGVRKTVDATEAEFAKLRAGFDEMALRTPIAITELIGLGEAAGQLGIQTKNILGFSETMAQLGATTDLSSQEAATALARLANITQMSQEDFDRLGATIVDLGNNLATTESEIVDMGLRLAGAGQAVGLSESAILSLGAAMSSLGIRAESGGSSMSRVLLEMNTAVLSGTKNLQVFAKVAGKTAIDFAKIFKKAPEEAIALFVEGLGRIKESGGDVAETLRDLGLSNIRIIDLFNRLSGSGDLLRRSLKLGSKAWDENTALVEEARKKYKSMGSQFVILFNALKLVGAEFFEVMQPAIEMIVEKLKKLLIWLKNLNPEVKKIIIVFAGLAAAIGPALILIGTMAGIMGAAGLAAVGTAASILTVVAALVVLKNAPQIGEFMLENFKIIEQVASNFILNVLTGWKFIEFGFRQMITFISIGWDKMIRAMTGSLVKLLDTMAKIPKIGKVFANLAIVLRKPMDLVVSSFAENKRILIQDIAEIQKLSKVVFSEIEEFHNEKEQLKVDAIEKTKNAFEEFLESITPKIQTATRTWQSMFDTWAGEAIDTFNNLSQIATNAMDGLSDKLTDVVLTGKADFNALAESILRDITRMIIKAQLAAVVMRFLPGISPIIPGVTTPVTIQDISVPELARGGIVQPVFAAKGFVARGTDTVPAMLTPGEMVIPKRTVDAMGSGGGGGTVNITVTAIDAQGTFQFLNRNKSMIASMIQSASAANHPIRRGQG